MVCELETYKVSMPNVVDHVSWRHYKRIQATGYKYKWRLEFILSHSSL